jgi:seryl-tRNA(Sec) selenium transferase
MPDGPGLAARGFHAGVLKSRLPILIALACTALLADASGQSTQPPPDLILRNGHIVTVDGSFSIAEAVAIAGGRFVAVGK